MFYSLLKKLLLKTTLMLTRLYRIVLTCIRFIHYECKNNMDPILEVWLGCIFIIVFTIVMTMVLGTLLHWCGCEFHPSNLYVMYK